MSDTQIIEPNYTQIPNIIFDYWMVKLSPAEFKVLLFMCRKTFGWHKQVDSISLSQIEKYTGLSHSGIIKNLGALEAHGLIVKSKSTNDKGDPNTNKYVIKVHSVHEGSALSIPPLVHSVDQGVVHSVDQQKKGFNTKETLQKEEGGRASAPTPKKDKIKQSYGSEGLVKLTDVEHAKLLADYGASKLTAMIENLDLYIASTGKRYQSHCATMRLWDKRDKAPKASKKPSAYPEHDKPIIPNNFHDYSQEQEKHE